MRKVFAITLEDDDIPLSHDLGSDIRELAYWIYSELGKFDEQILCIDNDQEQNTEGLIKNELYDVKTEDGYAYKFESDIKNIDNRLFEPFILSDNTFGFTVYEGSLSDSELKAILDSALKLLKMNYKYKIDVILYNERLNNRLQAIDLLIKKPEVVNNVKKRVKVPTKVLTPILNIW